MRFFSSLRSTPSQGVSSSSSSSHPPRHSPSSSSSSECSCYSRYLHDKHTVQELVFLERHVDAFHLVSCMCEVYPLHLIHNDLDLIEVLYRFKTTDQVYRLLGQDECASNLLLSSRHLPSYVKKLSFSSSSSLTSSSPSTVATAGQRGGGGEEEGGGRRRISGVRGEKKDTWGEAACCCDRLLKDQDRNFCQERKEKEEERKNARDRKERRNENERTASLISLPFVCENRRDRRVCPLQQYCSQEVKERKEKDHPKEEEEERMCECVERLRKRREVRARREGGRSAAYEGRSKTTDEEKDSSTKKEKEREERRVDSKEEEEEEEERWIRDILTPLKLSLYEEALSQSIHPLVTGKSPGPWHCAVDDGDGRVKIYVRNYQDNRELLTFRIEGQIEAPLLSILSVLNEVDLFKLWVPYYTRPFKLGLREVSGMSLGRVDQVVQFHVDFPWPFSDRDALFEVWAVDDLERNGQIVVKMSTLDQERPSPRIRTPITKPLKGVERMCVDGSLVIVPQGNNSSYIRLLWHENCRMHVPLKMVDFVSNIVARAAFNAFRGACRTAMTGVHEERRKSNRFLYGFVESRLRDVGLLGEEEEDETERQRQEDEDLNDRDDDGLASSVSIIPEENILGTCRIPHSSHHSVHTVETEKNRLKREIDRDSLIHGQDFKTIEQEDEEEEKFYDAEEGEISGFVNGESLPPGQRNFSGGL